ncbi:serine protease [Pseudomonas sp. v388]|uniref:trypsin-like peptidase domain-containing protein n=1 Tax=Pseudomonas sp. v388 TaxID=2479849 RepID=UPI000F778A22|nr:trypsin-like peptidase domain-containing protein [Pseudomonas sp. v388]RRV03949.1 serine protease [Pseudomonas sp. v388]
MNVTTLAAALSIIAALPCFAQATPTDIGEGLVSLAPSRVLLNADGSREHWNGIGRIQSKKGLSCTATLLDTRSADGTPDAPAYVLTSGHCISRKNGLIITDGEIDGAMQFNYFTDTTPRSYPLKRISWSSLQGVDMAIVELQPTLQSLIDAGIRPLPLADQLPEKGREVFWVGAPLYQDTGRLRMAACTHQPSGEILNQPWVWRHSVSNRCKDVDTGASGSPLIVRDSGEIYAVMNLVTQPLPSGAPPQDDDPLPPGFPPLEPDSNFGSPVIQLKRCFVNGVLSTEQSQCSLFPTFSIRFDPATPPKHYAKVRTGDDGQAIFPGWNLRFTVDQPFYRYKKADSALDCERPAGYSKAIASQNATIDDPVDARIGINWLCIVGLASAKERPSHGLMRNALTLAIELQPAGPTAAPRITIEKTRFNAYSVHWSLDSGLIDHYTVKVGPVDTTDCSDPQGFKRRFGNLELHARSLPRKICTYAHDVNGQRSDVREDIVGEPGS